MSIIPQTYTCDVCGKRRDGDANNWVTMYEEVGLTVLKGVREITGSSHACGYDHACILFAGWLNGKASRP